MGKTPKNIKTKTFIYTLSDPETGEIRYIGKTVKNLKIRLTGHIYDSKKVNNHRCNWIKSIINKNKKPTINLIDFCEWDESQKLEEYWISQFKTWGFNLVNETNGGEGTLGLVMSQKMKQKLIFANSKVVYQYDLKGEFIKEFPSCAEAGRQLNIKSISKIGCAARGKLKSSNGFLWSYSNKQKLGEYKKSTTAISNNHKNILKKMRSKPILQYSLDNKFIQEWESANIAAKELDLDYISIIKYLNGKRTNHKNINKIGNYIWKRKKI